MKGSPVAERPALLCRARARLCALPLQHVIETMRPLPVEPFAGAPPFVRGLALIRGRPVPVVDVGALVSASEPANPTRFVTLRVGDRRVALALESVLGIRALPDAMSGLPPLLTDASAEAVSAVSALDAELLLVLEAARLVPDSLWLGLDAER